MASTEEAATGGAHLQAPELDLRLQALPEQRERKLQPLPRLPHVLADPHCLGFFLRARSAWVEQQHHRLLQLTAHVAHR